MQQVHVPEGNNNNNDFINVSTKILAERGDSPLLIGDT